MAREAKTDATILLREYNETQYKKIMSLNEIYKGTSGSINEAYADILACCYSENWVIGEEIVGVGGIRDIATPHLSWGSAKVGDEYYVDYSNFDNYSKDNGGEHINSTIISHAAYLMKEKGIEFQELAKLWYKSLQLGYKKHSDFYNVRDNVIKAAEILNYKEEEIQMINHCFDEVNITKYNCRETDESYFQKLDKFFFIDRYFLCNARLYGNVVMADDDTIIGNNKGIGYMNINVYSADVSDKEIEARRKNGISIINDSDFTKCDSIMTESNETYVKDIKKARQYRLEFEEENYIPEKMYFTDVDSMFLSQCYCGTVELIPEQYAGYGSASGKIISASTGEGVRKLTLNIRRGINNIYGETIKTMETDYDGNYFLDMLEGGNYCVEIVDENKMYISTFINIKVLGSKSITGQDGVVSTELSENQIRVVLSWGDTPRDLDSHMLCDFSNLPEGHVYYQNKSVYNNKELVCMLDIDDTSGYGPETTTIYKSESGSYTFYVYNYSNESKLSLSRATVKVYVNGSAYPAYTFNVPDGEGRYWTVFRYNGATRTICPVDDISNDVIRRG